MLGRIGIAATIIGVYTKTLRLKPSLALDLNLLNFILYDGFEFNICPRL
jgi:hypothetical protein